MVLNDWFRLALPGITLLFLSAVQADEPLELDDLVVTAAIAPMARDEIAGSVTIITRQEIEQRQAKYLSDILRNVPGFAVSQSGGSGSQTQIRVRGSEANHILVLMDGVRVNDPASADEFQFQYALSSDIERIEILRGPQSATWGTDALSAVVNIIRKNQDKRSTAKMNAEGGSFNTSALNFGGTRVWVTGRLWGDVSRLETDGINISRLGNERDGAENTTVSLGAQFELSETLTLDVSGRYVDSANDFDEIDFFVTGLPVDADRVTEVRRTYLQSHLKFTPLGSSWSADLSVAGTQSENENFADGSWTSSTAADSIQLSAKAGVLIANGKEGTGLLSFALDHQNHDFFQRGLESFFGNPNQDQNYDVLGSAIEYVGRPNKALTWSASVRRDKFSDFDDADTWQVSGSRKLDNGWRLRGSFGTGSKAPTFSERFGFYEGSFIGNPGLKPEKSSGWEIGLASDLSDGRVSLDLAYFDHDLEDEIDGFVFDPASGLFTAANKQNSSERKGVELTVHAEPVEGFSLGFNYSNTKATETDFMGNSVVEVRRPENQANIYANFSFADDRANVNINVNYTGDQFDLFFSPETFLSEQIVLPSRTVVNLAAAWRLNKTVELVARIENLFDESYEEVLGFLRPGRSAYAGFRLAMKP